MFGIKSKHHEGPGVDSRMQDLRIHLPPPPNLEIKTHTYRIRFLKRSRTLTVCLSSPVSVRCCCFFSILNICIQRKFQSGVGKTKAPRAILLRESRNPRWTFSTHFRRQFQTLSDKTKFYLLI